MKPLIYRKSRRVRGTKPERHKMHFAKGDTVRVIAGDDRGKEGRVLEVDRKTLRVTIEGVNLVKKHQRARTPDQQSEIITKAAPIAASKVMLLDPKSGRPTRVRRRRDKDGTIERIAARSGQPIPRTR